MSDIEPVQCTRPNSRRVNKHLMSRLVVKQIFVVTGTISEKHWATALKHSEVIMAMLYSLHSEISQYATSWRMSWMFWNGLQSHFSKVKSVFYFHPITDKDISLYRQMHDVHAQADINFRLQLRDCSNSEYIILNEQIRCLKQIETGNVLLLFCCLFCFCSLKKACHKRSEGIYSLQIVWGSGKTMTQYINIQSSTTFYSFVAPSIYFNSAQKQSL